ncbi:MAG: chorismate-binding protein [Spirochaetota bacterium]
MINTKACGESFLIKEIQGEKFTPFSLCLKLKARALLESATLGKGKGQHSILLLDPAFTVYQKNAQIYMYKDKKTTRLKTNARDILDVVLHFAHQHPVPAHPLPFPAGGVGYLSYEYARHFDDVHFREKPDPSTIPDAMFIFGHIFLIFDHYTDTITILGLNYNEHRIDLNRAVQKVEQRIYDMDFNYMHPGGETYNSICITPGDHQNKFLSGVDKVRREIIKGNLLQGVLSRRVVLRTEIPAIEAYRRLRSLNPSPYMFYLDAGSFQLFGSSPEVHVKVTKNRVIMRPIAGTRKRGKDSDEDRLLARELVSDEKEQAEHLMLVDLARNDLGRVCTPDSIEVSQYMSVEHYSHVIHLVSQVEGILQKDKTGLDAVRKTFPAGTVSGAPKIKAMEIIDTLEPEKRGFYAGVVGYIEPGGYLDTCITIRSALKKDDLLLLQAGAGIVYDSVPAREYHETTSKLKALGASLGVEV